MKHKGKRAKWGLDTTDPKQKKIYNNLWRNDLKTPYWTIYKVFKGNEVYIGKTNYPLWWRLRKHISEATTRPKTSKDIWISQNLDVMIEEVCIEHDKKESHKKEAYWYNFYKDSGYIMKNVKMLKL